MISVSNLSKEFGDRVLFEDVSFQLNPGERYGIVGANGSGKTTLLSILSGNSEPSGGTVSIPRSARLGVLRQDHFLYENEEVLKVALMGHPELWDVIVGREEVLARAHEHFDGDRFSELEEAFQRLDGYTAESRAATILEGLGLPAEVHRKPLSTLSGGFKLRVLLAQTLAGNPDVLLLDEPTNHLDILSIRWLEKFLQSYAGPLAVISHDHRFLDNVATSILDVDYETVTMYRGNYTSFLEQKRSDRERREKEIEGRKKEIAHHQQFVDRFKAKASKARQAQSKLRMIEKKADELEELPGSSRRYPRFRFEPKRPSGKEVLKIDGVRKAYGDRQVLHGADLRVERGDRLVIMGPNGIGKSTLLRIVMGDASADSGEVVWGYETRPGYFAQDHHEQISGPDRTVEQWLWDFCPGRDRGFVRGQLGLMLFTGGDGDKKISALSGGEAARLVFARLMLDQPNVLVLDEPTNHLDLESIEALVNGLQNYEGTLILVSHDRWFVGQLATRIVEISANGVRDFRGSYEEYVHTLGDDHLDADSVVLKARRESRPRDGGEGKPSGSRAESGKTEESSRGAASSPSVPDRPARPSASRQKLIRQRDELTTRISTTESRVGEIDALFASPGFFDRTATEGVRSLERERSTLGDQLDQLIRDWEKVESELETAL
ncbi:MAG: ATP-binding cassette domain-containing protein [Gemmatimonadota bacterium]|nr:ATP-binding cassette domain-containing protein [Gemmatimonadota bacterium]